MEPEMDMENPAFNSSMQSDMVYHQEILDILKSKVFPAPYEYLIIAIYGLVFLLAIIGNTLVCIAVLRNEHMRTVTNYYIVNLAVADILVSLVCLPVTVVVDVSETWFFGGVLCLIIPYIQNTSVCVSVFTLTMIAVDRFLAICYPLKFQSSARRTIISVIVIWCVSLAITLANPLTMEVTGQKWMDGVNPVWLSKCVEKKWDKTEGRKAYYVVMLVFTYIIPLYIIGLAYMMVCVRLWSGIPSDETSCQGKKAGNNNSGHAKGKRVMNKSTEAQLQSRRKVARMLIVVVVIFAVCYLPIRVLNVLSAFGAFSKANVDMMAHSANLGVAYLIAHMMAFINSAINPLIYNFMSAKFRQAFKMTFNCCGSDSKRHSRYTQRYTKCQSFNQSSAISDSRANTNTECFSMANRPNSIVHTTEA
ncbi:orexin receptor type 2-like [Asterias amurensis]|uniref:orexin receptor type 2-like n=1 Tax=Asterias amurensis TaxID=7602 RepID=UPI003AB70C8A